MPVLALLAAEAEAFSELADWDSEKRIPVPLRTTGKAKLQRMREKSCADGTEHPVRFDFEK